MAGTKEGARKQRVALLAEYGGVEGLRQHMREIASKGGKAKNKQPRGFARMDKALHLQVAAKGGSRGKRT